jgi:phosphoribosyl 1,2-cyclic phosphodiesterase
MYIKCWGARGASPVSGKQFLKYGGNTTCIEVRAGDPEQTILIDFGSGAPAMGRDCLRTNRMDLDVLITHTHWDHITGFPLFPLLFIPGSRIRFYYNSNYQGNPEKLVIQDMMTPPHFPVSAKDLSASFSFFEVGSEFFLGPIKIRSIPLSHPNLGLGYRLEYLGKSFVFLTDNELGFQHQGAKTFQDYVLFCRDADLLIHDAEYFSQEEYQQKKGFGHSLVQHALDLGARARVKSLGFFHHNSERTDEDIDLLLSRLASANPRFKFDIFAVAQEMEVNL